VEGASTMDSDASVGSVPDATDNCASSALAIATSIPEQKSLIIYVPVHVGQMQAVVCLDTGDKGLSVVSDSWLQKLKATADYNRCVIDNDETGPVRGVGGTADRVCKIVMLHVSVSVMLERQQWSWPVVGDVQLRCVVAALPHSDILVPPSVFRQPGNPFCAIFYAGTKGAVLGDSHALLQSHVVRGNLAAAVGMNIADEDASSALQPHVVRGDLTAAVEAAAMAEGTLSAASVTSTVADASTAEREAAAWESDRQLMIMNEEMESDDELDTLNDRALEARQLNI
jgi:hypothetical protein